MSSLTQHRRAKRLTAKRLEMKVSDNFFDDYDMDTAADDPFAAPIGTWKGTMTKWRNFTTKDETQKFIARFKAREGASGFYDHWMNVPQRGSDDWEKDRATLKKFFLDMGVPRSTIEGKDKDGNKVTTPFNPADLEGTNTIMTTVKTENAKEPGRYFVNLRGLSVDDGTYEGEIAYTSGAPVDEEEDWGSLVKPPEPVKLSEEVPF